MLSELQELEARLRSIFGGWSHYQLRLWQQCRSIDAAGVEDRIRVAKEVLAATHRGDWIWALGGWWMLLGEIQTKLSDADPHIRGDAIVALTEFGLHARYAVPILLDRLHSPDSTLHDKTLIAWALPRIGVSSEEKVPALLALLEQANDQVEAGELRRLVAEAVEFLAERFRVLVPLARQCLRDQHWTCRRHGLLLVERLTNRHRRLLPMLLPYVQPLLTDEVEEVRRLALRISEGAAASELQN